MMDQGYLRTFLKFAGYTVLTIVVFFVLLFATQDQDEIEEFFSHTDFTERIYDYWDWKRFSEDFKDVRFTGYLECYFTGDTLGLHLDPRYYQFVTENMYREHFGRFCPFIDFDNFELVESDPKVKDLHEQAAPEQTQVTGVEIFMRWWGFGPVFYKVIVHSGTVNNKYAYKSTYVNLGSAQPSKLRNSLEHGIDRQLKGWAKRFYKIQGNQEQLKELYKSVYQK